MNLFEWFVIYVTKSLMSNLINQVQSFSKTQETLKFFHFINAKLSWNLHYSLPRPVPLSSTKPRVMKYSLTPDTSHTTICCLQSYKLLAKTKWKCKHCTFCENCHSYSTAVHPLRNFSCYYSSNSKWKRERILVREMEWCLVMQWNVHWRNSNEEKNKQQVPRRVVVLLFYSWRKKTNSSAT